MERPLNLLSWTLHHLTIPLYELRAKLITGNDPFFIVINQRSPGNFCFDPH